MNWRVLENWSYWEVLADKTMVFGLNLVEALVIFVIGRWLTTKLVLLLRTAMRRAKVEPTLVSFLGNVTSVVLLIVVIVTALGRIGIPTTSVAALIGGVGLAVSLSLKDQLSNFAAGALIIFFRPFRVGDYIKVSGYEGFVQEIKITQISLRTYAHEEVILPNSVVMGTSIVNCSSLPLWRSQVIVGVDYACDLKTAKAAVLKAATEHPKCLTSKAPSVQITNLGDDAIEITLWAWSTAEDWWTLQCDLYEAVVENLRAVNINIPFPQRDIHIIDAPPETARPAN